jgi:hypothetical protein
MTMKQRKEALRIFVLQKLKADIGLPTDSWPQWLVDSNAENPESWLLCRRQILLNLIAAQPVDDSLVTNIMALYVDHLREGWPWPAEELRLQCNLFTSWDYIVLQRWWRSWIRYRRFKRFITQPRYSAYLNEEGQLGRRVDNKAQLQWSRSRACK